MSLENVDVRDAFFDQLYELGAKDPNVVILSADMDAFSLRRFAKDYPKQYLNVGVSEQNMINVAAGMALHGKKVFCYSIASFATLRCFEQIKVNVCSLNLPVCIIGAGAGFSFGYDGPTHHGQQDLSSMRLLPEMAILELSSNDIAQNAARYAYERSGPCYIRLDKGPYPDWSSKGHDFEKGYRLLRPLKEWNLVTNGYMAKAATDAVDALAAAGIDCGLVDIFRIKPLPEEFVHSLSANSECLISVEESCRSGGLSTSLAEALGRTNASCKLLTVAAPDRQLVEYGTREWFHEKYGLDCAGIVSSVKSLRS